MKYGTELIESLEDAIARDRASIADRSQRIADGLTDIDDCMTSQRNDERNIANAQAKIALIRNGGCAWFPEYATLDGTLVSARWCDTRFGRKLRVEMPDGSVVWTAATTAKGLAKVGLKSVECKRPAWFKFGTGSGGGMLAVYTGSYVLIPSDVNYATGEAASADPIEIRDAV
jgi:hypothetical protein